MQLGGYMHNYKFIGWNTTDGSDKVWGVIYLEDPSTTHYAKCITFWGRRGKKFQSKLSHNDYQLEHLVRQKITKGYHKIDIDHLNSVYPEFEKDLNKLAFWSSLKY